MNRFTARLEPVPHGGLYVVLPARIAADQGIAHGARVRGTVNGVEYRSAAMKYSGVFHVGIHKPATTAASVGEGDRVKVTIEVDDEPLPTDVVPDDLHRALTKRAKASESWPRLAPAVRRGYVKSVLEAKEPETRTRRIANIVETLTRGVPPRRTWTPARRG
jgi:hypothetical protein